MFTSTPPPPASQARTIEKRKNEIITQGGIGSIDGERLSSILSNNNSVNDFGVAQGKLYCSVDLSRGESIRGLRAALGENSSTGRSFYLSKTNNPSTLIIQSRFSKTGALAPHPRLEFSGGSSNNYHNTSDQNPTSFTHSAETTETSTSTRRNQTSNSISFESWARARGFGDLVQNSNSEHNEVITFSNANKDVRIKKLMNNDKLIIRVIVDQGRAGMGHQAATVTGINRLLDLGFKGKIEIIATDLMGGKEKFLSLASGLKCSNANQKFSTSDARIVLSDNIVLRTIRSIDDTVYYEDSLETLSPADILFSPACDYSFNENSLYKYHVKYALTTRPTGYIQNGHDGQLISPTRSEYVPELKNGILFSIPKIGESDSVLIQQVVQNKNQGDIEYVNIIGVRGFIDQQVVNENYTE